MPHRTILAVLFLAAAFFLLPGGALALEQSPGVVVHTDQAIATSPGIITGYGADLAGDPVVVHCYIDGVEIEGSPDTVMDGNINEFNFHIPEGQQGKVLAIIAEAADGSSDIQTYNIQ